MGVREVVEDRRLVDHNSTIAYAKSKMLRITTIQERCCPGRFRGQGCICVPATEIIDLSNAAFCYRDANNERHICNDCQLTCYPNMHDQTLIFKKLDISSVTLSDDCGKTQAKEIKDRGYRILLTSPEARLHWQQTMRSQRQKLFRKTNSLWWWLMSRM